jgi:hypothetical protein
MTQRLEEPSAAERAVATALDAMEAGEYPEPPAELVARAREFLDEVDASLAASDGEAARGAAQDLTAIAAVLCERVAELLLTVIAAVLCDGVVELL